MKLVLNLALTGLCTIGFTSAVYAEESKGADEKQPASAQSSHSDRADDANNEKDRKKEIWEVGGNKCTVLYDDPFVTDKSAADLFAISRNGFKEEITGQLEQRAAELDDSFAINFAPDGKPTKIISGKEAALEAMKKEAAHFAEHPPTRIVFSYPYAQSYGDSAVVTYKCLVVGRGDMPFRSSGFITNIYVKRDSGWKQVHRSSKWKVLSRPPAAATTSSAAKEVLPTATAPAAK
ncbi:MAG TPA: hypothetical protein V6C81_17230 [Planktothrix sp.]|jgi:hypothetical protein